jgi:hypothetical protein
VSNDDFIYNIYLDTARVSDQNNSTGDTKPKTWKVGRFFSQRVDKFGFRTIPNYVGAFPPPTPFPLSPHRGASFGMDPTEDDSPRGRSLGRGLASSKKRHIIIGKPQFET